MLTRLVPSLLLKAAYSGSTKTPECGAITKAVLVSHLIRITDIYIKSFKTLFSKWLNGLGV
jgi:hypothetical protein